MTMIIISFLAWSVVCVFIGYKTGANIKIKQLQIDFRSLNFRQAAKWLLIHERERHIQDVLAIDADVLKLRDVEIPDDLKALAGNIRFEV